MAVIYLFDLRCLICGKTAQMQYSELKKSDWLYRVHDESINLVWHGWRITLCPEHNGSENYEKAVSIRRERYRRQVAEDQYPDWSFES